MSQRTTYHHGDLRSALVNGALDLVAEVGVARLSVAEAARRAGVSTAAPYRHFPNRLALLSAAAGEAARRLSAQMDRAIEDATADAAGPDPTDPAERLALLAAVYVGYAFDHGPVFELILADELHEVPDEDRRSATRELFDHLLWPAIAITGDVVGAEPLLRAFTAVVAGYSYLPRGGFLRGFPTDLRGAGSAHELFIREAADAVRVLAHAAR